MIQVDHYQKNYGETIAVQDLSFEVAPGTVMGMVGPNGAGKTTTLRAIAGILPPTRGRLAICGHDVVQQSRAAKMSLAYIPDEPRLFDALTVWEHLQFSAASYRVSDWQNTAVELLEQFQLIEKKDALAQELSRGMRQKVAICCGYLHDPKAILFDEPHTGLDPHAIRKMKETVRQRASDGAAVIVSSHLLSLIEDLCSHLLILSQGRSLFFGTLDEVHTQFPDIDSSMSLEEIFFRATGD